ncbi:unnamed protein product [Blepharisma stoltei]|uniref:PLAC8 family protein n=1 Tax=Blepharisma stoltei TaxID=1481888 RepID=A0AAU9K9G6_9CILI|nr:unnamed protein product [Blepharisma stoltei]
MPRNVIRWEQPLCGCFSDVSSCMIVCLICPGGSCIYQALTVSKATGDSCYHAFCCSVLACCIGAAINRKKVRDRYLIDGSCVGDCITHLFCGPLAVCQEHREVYSRESMYPWR